MVVVSVLMISCRGRGGMCREGSGRDPSNSFREVLLVFEEDR